MPFFNFMFRCEVFLKSIENTKIQKEFYENKLKAKVEELNIFTDDYFMNTVWSSKSINFINLNTFFLFIS